MGPWQSASEQIKFPGETETRRISEWPVAPGPGSTRLFAMDPQSITLTPKKSPYKVTVLPPQGCQLPPRRFNVLLCGAAAAISTNMLTWGSRIKERCMPKYEPLMLLCVAEFPPDPSAIVSGVDAAFNVLRDPDTLIDAVVWYDIEHPGYLLELRELDRARKPRGRVPILALRPFASWHHAAREYSSVRAGQLMPDAHNEYLALRRMIESGKDDDPNGILQRLP